MTGGSSFTVSSSVDGTLSVHEYSGVATSSPFDKVASSTGSGTALSSGNVTTALGSELYVGLAWSGGDGNTWTAGSGYTLRESETNNNTAERHASEDRVISSGTTTSATFTTSGSALWLVILATFKPLVTQTQSGTTTGTATTTLTYDQSGNLLTQGTSTYTWDWRDRLVQWTNGTATSTYAYDHENRRVRLTEGNTTTLFPSTLYSTTLGASPTTTTKHIFASGLLLATVESTGTSTGGGAIAFNASSTSITTGYNAGPVTKTWTHTTSGSDRLLVLMADIWQDVGGTGTITSASYGGQALTKVTNTRSGGMASEIWYLENPPTGANTMSVTITGATDAIKLGVASLYGSGYDPRPWTHKTPRRAPQEILRQA